MDNKTNLLQGALMGAAFVASSALTLFAIDFVGNRKQREALDKVIADAKNNK